MRALDATTSGGLALALLCVVVAGSVFSSHIWDLDGLCPSLEQTSRRPRAREQRERLERSGPARPSQPYERFLEPEEAEPEDAFDQFLASVEREQPQRRPYEEFIDLPQRDKVPPEKLAALEAEVAGLRAEVASLRADLRAVEAHRATSPAPSPPVEHSYPVPASPSHHDWEEDDLWEESPRSPQPSYVPAEPYYIKDTRGEVVGRALGELEARGEITATERRETLLHLKRTGRILWTANVIEPTEYGWEGRLDRLERRERERGLDDFMDGLGRKYPRHESWQPLGEREHDYDPDYY